MKLFYCKPRNHFVINDQQINIYSLSDKPAKASLNNWHRPQNQAKEKSI